jgi:hypothetical protein
MTSNRGTWGHGGVSGLPASAWPGVTPTIRAPGRDARGPVFAHARTPEDFAEARVDAASGTVSWPGGADLAPDALYERVRTGAWPGEGVAAA